MSSSPPPSQPQVPPLAATGATVRPIRLAVLLSGSGTTLENLYGEIAAGRLPAEIVVVLSSRTEAFGLQRARDHGTPTEWVERKRYSNWRAHADAVWQALKRYKFDGVVLAGYMCRLSVPQDYRGKILNVHPALLPAFGGQGMYGHHVHEAVIAAGASETGCTVHIVDDQYDHGPVLAQTKVAVEAADTGETLAARVQAAERALYPVVIRDYFGKQLSRQVQ